MPRSRLFLHSLFLVIAATALACGGSSLTAPGAATLQITTSTTGTELDPDGYTVQVDASAAQAIGLTGTVQSTDISPGDHTVLLAGIAPNCAVSGSNPRAVSVAAGQTATVSFAVTCGATTGGIQITTMTTGPSPDPDGYTVTVDGTGQATVGATGSVNIPGLAAGNHAVGLSGVAANCQVQGDNPRTTAVTAGGNVTVAFAITCTALPPAALRWQPMASGTNFNLFGVWGSSPTDVFAVGSDNAAVTGTATILHYDGRAWSEQARKEGIYLGSVWGAGAADVFAVGYEAVVLHQDGTGWQAMPRPNVDVPTGFNSVWGTSGTDVFAAGGVTSGTSPEAVIIHYDGTTWSRMTLTSSINRQLRGIAGTSSRDVYAVGIIVPTGAGIIYHYDGLEWKDLTVPGLESLGLNGVWSSSPSDVFVVGQGLNGIVLHFDGHTWSRMVIPTVGTLWVVWGSSASDVYAVGDGILHYDGKGWTKVNDIGGSGVWGSSPTDVFVVGKGGTIFHGTP